MRALPVVMLLIRLGHFAGFLQRARPMYQQAFILVASMVSFHKCVLLWLLLLTDMWLNAQAEQETTQSRRKIPAALAAHPAGITIKGEHGRQTVALKELHHHIEGRFCTEIISYVCLK